uniref:DUF7627 domain-containing protein n=1 Tax=Acrobeloides nanus TaxID=290746 RepID=A0A914DAM7_9BILA
MAEIASSSTQSVTSDKINRRQRNAGPDSGRNRRMMANIQASLGGKVTQPTVKRNIPNKPVDSTFKSVEEMLAKLKLANDDVDISVSDIRPYLIDNAGEFSQEDFENIAESFCNSALIFMNIHFIVELCIILIKHKNFQSAMSEKLDELISNYILNRESNLDAIPAFMANLLTAKWPRPYNRAIVESNNILVSIISAIMGWIMVINENLLKIEDNTSEKEDLSKNKDNIDPIEQLEMISRCGKALCELCNTGQRGLWMSFPTLLDDIFEAIKSLIISELHISKSLRQSLLQVYVSIFKWTASNTKSMVSVSSQTLTKPF